MLEKYGVIILILSIENVITKQDLSCEEMIKEDAANKM